MQDKDDFEVARVLMDAINEATKRGLLRKSYAKVGPMMAATAMQLAVHKQHRALNNAGAQPEADKQAAEALAAAHQGAKQ